MIESEKRENGVPDQEEAEEKGKILDLDPHLDELRQRYAGILVMDGQGGQAERKDHDQEVEEFKGFEEDLSS